MRTFGCDAESSQKPFESHSFSLLQKLPLCWLGKGTFSVPPRKAAERAGTFRKPPICLRTSCSGQGEEQGRRDPSAEKEHPPLLSWAAGDRGESREGEHDGTAFSFCLFLLCFFPFSMKTWSSFSKKGKREERREGRKERERENIITTLTFLSLPSFIYYYNSVARSNHDYFMK